MEKQIIVESLVEKLKKSVICKEKTYRKNETITTYISNRAHLFILLSGAADLEHYSDSGALSVIEHITVNGIFGDQFHSFNSSNELTVVAKRRCTVLAFDYNELKEKLTDAQYREVFPLLIALMSEKIADLNNRTALLTKKSTREKLISYFESRSKKSNFRTFVLPYSYTDLAEYLSVERSAMMREIAWLEDDGIIQRDGRKITLLKN